MKKMIAILLMTILCVSACDFDKATAEEITVNLSDSGTTVDGKNIGKSGRVFESHDIIYYENKETYSTGNPYGEGTEADMHTKEEAEGHSVINITKSGTYRISGTLSAGQIRVDLGEDADDNPNAKVRLILDNANINCSVAPAILFLNVYECDDREEENSTPVADTKNAGAVIELADGSVNNINGSYVAKIYEDDNDETEKLWKQDGAVYSYMSMNIEGNGKLNVTAENEGIDTEMHLTINSGDINIVSDNDGINTNEDGVSVTTINGGNVNIVAGLGEEGDGIDSNGWLVINGGTVFSSAKPIADAGLDSDMGSFINGGTVVALGSTMDWPESDSKQAVMNLQFAEAQNYGAAIVIKDKNGETVFEFENPDKDRQDSIRDYRGAVISCPELKIGEKYFLESESKQYGYYITDSRGSGKKPPFGEGENQPGFKGERPDFDGKTPPDFEGKRPPEFDRENPPQFDGKTPSFGKGQSFEGMEQKTEFVINDEVNLFAGVSPLK